MAWPRSVPTGRSRPTAATNLPAASFRPRGCSLSWVRSIRKSPREERLRQLAELMTERENGRVTRTIVNRLWHRLMGRGIVHPVDAMQTEPWSGDLLDYLAVDLVDNGYNLKSTLRLIASSNAYQSPSVSLDAQPTNANYVYTGPMAKRMTAEQFVDALWQITGTAPREPHKRVAEFLAGDEAKRRSAYRASLVSSDLLMRSLGRPNREQVVSERPPTLTTLQALDLSNSPLLAETLSRGAPKIAEQFAGQEPAALVDWLYESSLSQSPDRERARTCTRFAGNITVAGRSSRSDLAGNDVAGISTDTLTDSISIDKLRK